MRLARGSIILSFKKVDFRRKKKTISFIYCGYKKPFALCLPLSAGDYVFTSGGWLLKAGQTASAGDGQHSGCQTALRITIFSIPSCTYKTKHTCCQYLQEKLNVLRWLFGMENRKHLQLMGFKSLPRVVDNLCFKPHLKLHTYSVQNGRSEPAFGHAMQHQKN